MSKLARKFAIEGLVDGQWAREHAGAVDDTTLFGSRGEAEDAIPSLAASLATRSEDDPAIYVTESDAGRRVYMYGGMPPTMPEVVLPSHRTRAARAIRRYHAESESR